MTLPQKRKRPRMMAPKEGTAIRCQGHLAWVRTFECAIARSHICEGRMEAHHVRLGTHTGIGQKPDDSTAVPLCSAAHKMLHDIGAQTFERRHALTLTSLAAALWQKSPHRLKFERSHQDDHAE